MKKKVLSALLCVSMVATMVTGCGSKDEGAAAPAGTEEAAAPAASGETIALTVWAAEEDQTLTAELVENFKAANPDQTFDITIGVESEAKAKDDILVDPEAAADVFAFASDQITDLVNAGVLQPVQDVDTISSENVAGSVDAATVDGTLYAYPMSADNGYFLFYDSTVVTDPSNWDAILADCAAAGKKAGMVMASGWYNAGFFYGAGFTTALNEDGSTSMDWNGTSADGIAGTDVAQAMLDIAGNAAFLPITDGDTSNQIAGGELGAIISGTWDAAAVQEAFGDGYAATALPTYTCAGEQVPMGSAAGYKMIGVNANSAQVGWAMELAKFLTNEESQKERFSQRQIGPSNIAAGEAPEVQENVALVAVTMQNGTNGVVQVVGGGYWEPTKTFGEIMAQGNPEGTDLQTLLDNLVAAVGQPTE
ncbi:MAG: extracellular solute-binding protein [Clostridiales bacterium]|nr:extracellular solute-binding protein [Roseburia sp.]MDD7637115.1 extracellular solute-binding protein [Clostridiales bacterium]MDY4112359.1 extracellular solute-binding protein [Roseburia sp.]